MWSVELFVIGSCIGFFVKCLADRYGSTCKNHRSLCTSCGHGLHWQDLIPVVSWLLLRGRCRYCGEKIPVSVLVIELGMGLLYVLSGLWFGIGWKLVEVLFLFSILVLMAEVDRRLLILPDRYQVFLLVGGLVWCRNWIVLLQAVGIFGFLLVQSLLFSKLLHQEAMGGGDIKLFAICTLYVGIYGIVPVIGLASLFALLYALFAGKKGKAFPFGPWIVMAMITVVFVLGG